MLIINQSMIPYFYILMSNITKLNLIDICHDFDGKDLFIKLNLAVKTGDIVAIVGTSGVGKSTLFNIAAGLITPKSGQVIIDGVQQTGRAGHVGYMLQRDLLLPFKHIYDNIALPLTIQGITKEVIQHKIMAHASDFGLTELLDKYPSQLSGGQRQRAALLRTYLSNTNLMLLDEPFSALDYVTKNQMYAWFRQFCRTAGLTCLIITHDIDEAIYLSHQIYVLSGFPAMLSAPFCIPKDAGFTESTAYLMLKRQILNAMNV